MEFLADDAAAERAPAAADAAASANVQWHHSFDAAAAPRDMECIDLATGAGASRLMHIYEELKKAGQADGADLVCALVNYLADTLSSSTAKTDVRNAHSANENMIPSVDELLSNGGVKVVLGPWLKEPRQEWRIRKKADPTAVRDRPRANTFAKSACAALDLADVPRDARAPLERDLAELVLSKRRSAGNACKAIVAVGGRKMMAVAFHATGHATMEKTRECAKVVGADEALCAVKAQLYDKGVDPSGISSMQVHIVFGGAPEIGKFRVSSPGKFVEHRFVRNTLKTTELFSADAAVYVGHRGHDGLSAQIVYSMTQELSGAAAAPFLTLGLDPPRKETFGSVALLFGGAGAHIASARGDSAAPPTTAAVQHAAADSGGGGCSTPTPKRRDLHPSPTKWGGAALRHHALLPEDDGARADRALAHAIAASAEDAPQHPVERAACDDDGDGEDAALTQALAASARAALTQALAASARDHAKREADRASEAENLRRALAESSLAHGAGSGSAR